MCKSCGIEKPLEQFKAAQSCRYGRTWICRACDVERARKRYRNLTDDVRRDKNLRRLYGITIAKYQEVLTRQGGVCAICKQPESRKSSQPLVVDHNHETGEVRGLLCTPCNLALGLLRDNPTNILALYGYVTQPKETENVA